MKKRLFWEQNQRRNVSNSSASLLVLCLIVSLPFSFSCAGRRLPPGARHAPVAQPQVGPERRASDALMERGKNALDQNLFEEAFDSFQEAANVDPTNGEAFYYLALVKYRTGDYAAVGDFLDKAEALLGNNPAWTEKLEILRRDISSDR